MKKIHLYILLFLFSAIVFQDSIAWLGNVFFGLYDLFNLFLLIITVALITSKTNWKNGFHPPEKIGYYPLVTLIISSVFWFISHKLMDINLFSSFFFLTFCFGLYGFMVPFEKWRNAIIPFLLITMTLPFGNSMDIYIGFPLRMFTTEIIAQIFTSLGFNYISNDTIITVENSATQIDFSCSGLKGLWAGFLFLFTLTWTEQLKINIKWLFTLSILIALLILGNIFRVFTIVYTISILKLPHIADIIHAPLGIISFAFSCLTIYLLVTKTSFLHRQEKNLITLVSSRLISDTYGQRIVLGVLVILFFIPGTESTSAHHHSPLPYSFNFTTFSLPLTEEEKAFFKEQNSTAHKFTFSDKGLSGSLLLVESNEWRGHHNPEFCIRSRRSEYF